MGGGGRGACGAGAGVLVVLRAVLAEGVVGLPQGEGDAGGA